VTLQRLNTWGRKTVIGCALLAVLAGSVVGSTEVPGKVMQFDALALPGVPPAADPCDIQRKERNIILWFCGESP